jgi:hypothetical protein
VYAADFNSSALEQTFKDYAPQIMCIGVDVTKQEDVDRMADRINAAGKGWWIGILSLTKRSLSLLYTSHRLVCRC